MFCDYPDLKKMCVCVCVYILLKNILYTKLTYFDHHNKNVEQLYLRIKEFKFNIYKSNATYIHKSFTIISQ